MFLLEELEGIVTFCLQISRFGGQVAGSGDGDLTFIIRTNL